MAKTTTCDGTGVEIPDDTPVTGHYGHQYADGARAIAEAYLAKVDEAHTEAAVLFAGRLERLRMEYRALLRELPDDV